MKLTSRSLMLLAVMLVGVLTACVGSSPTTERAFPYKEKNGALVCGARPAASLLGASPTYQHE